MAAIGSKRKRFLGDGNDSMEVTSLIRSLVHLPLGASGAKVHPSPGGFNSSRLALQSDPSGERCVAFVASGGGAWRHEVPFAGGVDVAAGKEAMLKPTTVTDGVTARLDAVSHRHEIQSLALHDPASADPSRSRSDDRVRLASVDASGRCLVTTIARDAASSSALYDLRPLELAGVGGDVHGWAGASFDPDAPDTAAVARMQAKSIDVFDGGTRVRTMHTPLHPRAIAYVTGSNPTGDGVALSSRAPLIAVAEGNQLSLWDARQAERGGCARRVTLCNRGQPLYALATGVSQGQLGGGAVKLPNMTGGEPLVLTAGAERGVHVLDADRWTVVKRWPSAIKFEITMAALSSASPDHCYLAGLDNELLCGCWSRGSMAGGFAFRGDSRWLGMAVAKGFRGAGAGGGAGAGPGPGGGDGDVVAGWCESGHLFAARVARTPHEP